MLLEVITPQRTVFSGEVSLVKVPGSKGSFEILKNHAPVISTLSAGELKFDVPDSGETHYYKVGNGVVEVKNNHVIVLVDSLEKK